MGTNALYRGTEKGISLIEMAIALIVIGLLLLPLMKMYQIERTSRINNQNITKLDTLNNAILQYARVNGRLPMPARPDLDESSDDYGKGVAVASPTCANLNTAGLKCKATDYDTNDSGSVADEIVAGFVPYKDLNLSIDDAIDVYGSKITYVASRQLLTAGTLPAANNQGAILILNQDNGSFAGGGDVNITWPSSKLSGALYLVVSHGPDRRGAYLKNSTTVEPCLGGGLDATNCNQSTVASMPKIYRALQKYDTSNPSTLITAQGDFTWTATGSPDHFDDTIRFATTSADKLWTLNQNASREDIFSRETANARVGIGVAQTYSNGLPPNQLQVLGDGKSSDRTQTPLLCDKTGSSTASPTPGCFGLTNITGAKATNDDSDSVYCGANQPLLKVRRRGSSTSPAQRLCGEMANVATVDTTPFPVCPPHPGYPDGYGYKSFNGTKFVCRTSP